MFGVSKVIAACVEEQKNLQGDLQYCACGLIVKILCGNYD
jgi:hypothetical protein